MYYFRKKKQILPIIFSLLTPFCVSCRRVPTPSTPNEQFSTENNTPSIDNERTNQHFSGDFSEDFTDYIIDDFPPPQAVLPTPTAPDPAIWDVTDVDISYIDPARKLISFTFDDAPAKTLESILAVFAAFNEDNPDCQATATLFCNGLYFDNQSTQLLHAARALGFELGNHSYSHFDLTTLDPAQIEWEIAATDEILSRIDGKEKHLFRAPFGRIDETVRAQIQTPIMNWTIDTLDWTNASEEDVYSTVWNNKFSGGIVLMHDGYGNTVSALKRLLPDLKEAGYQVVSLSAMAKAHGVSLKNGGEYIRARKKGDG